MTKSLYSSTARFRDARQKLGTRFAIISLGVSNVAWPEETSYGDRSRRLRYKERGGSLGFGVAAVTLGFFWYRIHVLGALWGVLERGGIDLWNSGLGDGAIGTIRRLLVVVLGTLLSLSAVAVYLWLLNYGSIKNWSLGG